MIRLTNYFLLLSLNYWPLICRILRINVFVRSLLYIKIKISFIILGLNLFLLIIGINIWWMYYSKEIKLNGAIQFNIKNRFKFAIILFITSEVIFFLAFFWAYFHIYSSLEFQTGLTYNSLIKIFNPRILPFVNRCLLLTSAGFVMFREYYLEKEKFFLRNLYLLLTILFGLAFVIVQSIEYNRGFFAFNDSALSSVFYFITGLHGAHVIIGILYLIFSLFITSNFDRKRISIKLASIYWHFVDFVWLFVYGLIYCLLNNL